MNSWPFGTKTFVHMLYEPKPIFRTTFLIFIISCMLKHQFFGQIFPLVAVATTSATTALSFFFQYRDSVSQKWSSQPNLCSRWVVRTSEPQSAGTATSLILLITYRSMSENYLLTTFQPSMHGWKMFDIYIDVKRSQAPKGVMPFGPCCFSH